MRARPQTFFLFSVNPFLTSLFLFLDYRVIKSIKELDQVGRRVPFMKLRNGIPLKEKTNLAEQVGAPSQEEYVDEGNFFGLLK